MVLDMSYAYQDKKVPGQDELHCSCPGTFINMIR